MTHVRRLLLATTNTGKLREYREMLKSFPVEILTLQDAGITEEIAEVGATIAENAAIKAEGYAALSCMLTVADDSGLEVEALNGEPGVRSARYAGEGASDGDLVRYLLSKLEAVPRGKRQAKFRCVIAIKMPGLDVETAEGVCEGVISSVAKGDQGFGYDPIFYLPNLKSHMAELPLDQKNLISHRGRAMTDARLIIERLMVT